MIELWTPAWTRTPRGVRAAASTRAGGVSDGPFASLNLSPSTGDAPEAVAENRRRFAAAVGFRLERTAVPRQVHGDAVAVVDAAGRLEAQDVDALATSSRDVALVAGFADCVPVFLASEDGRVVGLAHAGWRGAVAGVARRLVETLAARFDAPPRSLCAAFGPSIGPCCFETGPDVAARFAATTPEAVDGRRVDLRRFLAAELAALGVPGAPPTPPCTRCESDRFFSHRAAGGGPAGRFWATIVRDGSSSAAS
ncbi:MAG TPA: peptidoglycan editing factor PgeF [Planctomycetota bacterium]|nr:peptidoglycan editing factor PgeF [Planctomycetota bacterium]